VDDPTCPLESDNSFYEDPEEPVDVGTGEDGESMGAGDIVGAIIGFIILALFIVAFIIVVILMIIQKIIKKLTAD